MSHLPFTTAAIVKVLTIEFDETSPENVAMYIEARMNGPTPDSGDTVYFPRNATAAVKAAAIRAFVNLQLSVYEPGTLPLTNANIQSSGVPI